MIMFSMTGSWENTKAAIEITIATAMRLGFIVGALGLRRDGSVELYSQLR
jgi:hypothetical protein